MMYKKSVVFFKWGLYCALMVGSAIQLGFAVTVYRYFRLFHVESGYGLLNLALTMGVFSLVWIGLFLPFAQTLAVRYNVHWLFWTEHPLVECVVAGFLALGWVGFAVGISVLWFPALSCETNTPLGASLCPAVTGTLATSIVTAVIAACLSTLLLVMYRAMRKMTIRGSMYAEMM
ncbi:hypothetical protein H4R33_004727 [Dimargaris cristalligena]|nr:hypothetical protein H4R33_004727 [Dimargaris cristalligena]